MTDIMSRQIRLASRPKGLPTAANFTMAQTKLDPPQEGGRIIACGGISGYNDEKPRPGPSNLFNVITKRLTMKGLMIRDRLDH